MSKQILQNEIECRICNSVIFSRHVHDYKECKCGQVAVDGGLRYLKRAGDLDACKERSIVVTKGTYDKMLDVLNDDMLTNLGKLCKLSRLMRDDKESGWEIIENDLTKLT